MRVAFSGSHRTGKTTLIGSVSALMPAYEVIDEAYRLLEEAGHEFSDPPSIEDFEQQLRMSIERIATAPANALLDRCPLDFVAYLETIDSNFAIDDWLDDLRDAIAQLDLIIFVPIEAPDRIAVPEHEDRRLRRCVDQRLQELVLDDALGLDAAMLEVSGTLDERVRQVTGAMRL